MGLRLSAGIGEFWIVPALVNVYNDEASRMLDADFISCIFLMTHIIDFDTEGCVLMDYEEDFLQTVKETLAILRRRGKETRTWSDDRGGSVTGWVFDYQGYSDEILPNSQEGQNFWQETWGHRVVILATDGSFWRYSFDGEESATYPEGRIKEDISSLKTSYFVGDKGKPFSEAKEKLERLPYLS